MNVRGLSLPIQLAPEKHVSFDCPLLWRRPGVECVEVCVTGGVDVLAVIGHDVPQTAIRIIRIQNPHLLNRKNRDRTPN